MVRKVKKRTAVRREYSRVDVKSCRALDEGENAGCKNREAH